MSLNAEFEVGDAAQGLSCRDIRASYTALKYKCTNTLEHGGERCVSIDKGDGPVSWRRRENVYEQEVLCPNVSSFLSSAGQICSNGGKQP